MTRIRTILAAITFVVSGVASFALMVAPSAAIVIPSAPGAEVHCKAGAPATSCTVSVNVW